MKKKFALLTMIILMVFIGGQAALAAMVSPAIKLDGTPLMIKGAVREGSLYLPVRAISQALGGELSWSKQTQTVVIKHKGNTLSLNLKDMVIKANDHQTYMAYGPLAIDYRTYMQADFFSDNLGLQVKWDKKTNNVLLTRIEENAITIKTVKIASETKALITTIQYPVIEGLVDQKVQDGINSLFRQLADTAIAEGRQNAADLAPFVLQYPDMPSQCEAYLNYQIKYNQNDRISLVFDDYQYAGGAHGGTVQTGYTISLKTGQQYALKDLFKEKADYVSVITAQVKAQLDERDLTIGLFEPFGKISPDQSYYLSNNGVVVFFQQYEILPYAAGIQEFTTEYALLQDLWQNSEMITGKVGSIFSIDLKGNPTTGYTWHYTIENGDLLQLVSETSMADSGLIGAGSTFTWQFKAQKTGETRIVFKYYRSWEGEASVLPENIITYKINLIDTDI